MFKFQSIRFLLLQFYFEAISFYKACQNLFHLLLSFTVLSKQYSGTFKGVLQYFQKSIPVPSEQYSALYR